ncbi:Protein fam72a, partial [Cladochytrium tenue]
MQPRAQSDAEATASQRAAESSTALFASSAATAPGTVGPRSLIESRRNAMVPGQLLHLFHRQQQQQQRANGGSSTNDGAVSVTPAVGSAAATVAAPLTRSTITIVTRSVSRGSGRIGSASASGAIRTASPTAAAVALAAANATRPPTARVLFPEPDYGQGGRWGGDILVGAADRGDEPQRRPRPASARAGGPRTSLTPEMVAEYLTGGARAAQSTTTATTSTTPPPPSIGGVDHQVGPPMMVRDHRPAPSVHPLFRSKAVCELWCLHCDSVLCKRGMKAILLGNTKVELFSTDAPPVGVQLVFGDYTTRNCRCRIRDSACLTCGNTTGYHVTQPCAECLKSCNNGHFWMFLADAVTCRERLEPS